MQPNPWRQPEAGPPPSGGGRGWIWLLVALAAAGLAALLSVGGKELEAELVYRLGLALVVGASLVLFVGRRLRGRASQGLVFAAIWLGIVLVVALGYAYRGVLRDARDRLAMELMPGGADWAPGIVKVVPDRSGHYFVNAEVNGVAVRFLVDTGATGVALTRRDAERAGLRPETLAYNRTAQTAAGPAPYATVRLQRLAVGQIAFDDMTVAVGREMTGHSLLGMSFLSRLSGFSVEDGVLILRR